MTIQTDIAILGGGPGGYVAALRAAQLGAQVALIEEKAIGGVCLNVGCIPTKALLRSAEVYRTLRQAETFGLRLEGNVTPDWPAIQARKETIVQQLAQGVGKLLLKAGVQVLQGRGRFVAPRTLEVTTADGVQRVEAKHVVSGRQRDSLRRGAGPARCRAPRQRPDPRGRIGASTGGHPRRTGHHDSRTPHAGRGRPRGNTRGAWRGASFASLETFARVGLTQGQCTFQSALHLKNDDLIPPISSASSAIPPDYYAYPPP